MADDSFANDFDKVAKQNGINITELLADAFKKSTVDSGDFKFVDDNPKVVFTVSNITHLFQRFIGKPTYILYATFTISEGDRVVWKYIGSLRSDWDGIPEYSYDELMIPGNGISRIS